jgi:hypothetical protein
MYIKSKFGPKKSQLWLLSYFSVATAAAAYSIAYISADKCVLGINYHKLCVEHHQEVTCLFVLIQHLTRAGIGRICMLRLYSSLIGCSYFTC